MKDYRVDDLSTIDTPQSEEASHPVPKPLVDKFARTFTTLHPIPPFGLFQSPSEVIRVRTSRHRFDARVEFMLVDGRTVFSLSAFVDNFENSLS